jgi:hypothetical protein
MYDPTWTLLRHNNNNNNNNNNAIWQSSLHSLYVCTSDHRATVHKKPAGRCWLRMNQRSIFVGGGSIHDLSDVVFQTMVVYGTPRSTLLTFLKGHPLFSDF